MATTTSWEELLGSKNWDTLLDPLDQSLRELILRCGDFCQATYDAFVNDQNCKYCGASRYGKSSFFDKVMLESASDYEVANFLYATARVSLPQGLLLQSQSRDSWDRESNWFGYIAVTSDERTKALGRREIYIAMRGTSRNYEWVNVLGARPTSADPLLHGPEQDGSAGVVEGTTFDSDSEDEEGCKVMLGWLTIYTSNHPESKFTKLSLRSQLLAKIKELLLKYKDEKPSIVLTGHSLGATEAVLAAYDIAENGSSDDVPVTAIVFGCPQVGNKEFRDEVMRHKNLKILHVRNTIDLLTRYPGGLLGYVDMGTNFVIDTKKSPFLKESRNPGDWHNLQAMLHIVAGWNGKKGEFKLMVKRSIALVNKSCEFLKDECLVPGSWWVEKNKGLIKNDDGEWVLAPVEEEPVPEF
ncbi:Alpha/Beta hydrolase fold [Arabidopsis thaliana x Arabidopsis arenosa]|uniref:Phospholipase A1 n=1 Tax=Arabidopsis thaliana x Arabidopsis arenosa TaxID=1240361 RepID=A0A8T2ACX3_9BRAS|nr:Alpha/Beta hydrolase fold [Arabidopsis thaliana x Arabidopsis arenosa]